MDTYYDPKDLPKFGDIGEEAPELAKKFFDYYGAVFAEGCSRRLSLGTLSIRICLHRQRHGVCCSPELASFPQPDSETGRKVTDTSPSSRITTLRKSNVIAKLFPSRSMSTGTGMG